MPVAILAFTAGVLWYVAAKRANALANDLQDTWGTIERSPSRIIVSIAVISALVAVIFATRSAAGADASGYISEAASLSRGQLYYSDDLFDLTRGVDPYLTSPLGWRPASSGALQSPTYPPGLPLLMAVPHALAGVDGAAAVVIASAIVAIIATGLVGTHLGGAAAGVFAAALIAFTPIFIHQSIQPMSDVPVTAAWMLCFVLLIAKRSFSAGVACAVAVLIRPNLAPLAIVPLFMSTERVRFAIPVAVSGAALGGLQWAWYGSPLRNGYGSAEQLFAISNIGGNVTRYSRWLITTAPVFVVALAGFARMRSTRTVQGLAVFAALVIASYLVYAVFDDWSYLRFLLPAMAVFSVLAGIELAAWIQSAPDRMRAPLIFIVLIATSAHAVWIARSHDSFKLADQLHRVEQVADYVKTLPHSAVIVSGEQSGSMRYYTGRSILRWEAATPEALSAAVAKLEQMNRPLYVVLDAFEEQLFRAKFAAVPAVSLDWPPIVDAGTSHRTRVWNLADRERFVRGEAVATERIP